MSCDRCGKNPGTVRYTEVREGEAHKQKICEDCARELGFLLEGEETALPADPASTHDPQLVISIEAKGTSEPEKSEYDGLRCPGCGITGAELRRRPLFGCPLCYEAFRRPLESLLVKIHGSLEHRGRLPGGRTAAPVDVERLRREIDEAVANGDFESAARLRDRLKRRGASG